jgi:hypothetical protein
VVPDGCGFMFCGKGPGRRLNVLVENGVEEGVVRGVGGRAEAKCSLCVNGFCLAST